MVEPVFSSPSEFDERPAPKAREDCSIVDPVTREEVAKAIANSEDSAPGSGGIILEEMKLHGRLTLSVAFYNLWLLLGYTPKRFSDGDKIEAHN